MDDTLETPFTPPLKLKRSPRDKHELLQAWDSADELILRNLSGSENSEKLKHKKILILNDPFGALSCALVNFDTTTYTDSFLSFKAIQFNSQGRVQAIHRLQELSGTYDIVLVRIPKNLSFFEDILCHLSAHLRPESQIICGYMLKHEAKGSYELLNKYIGETSTSLAHKRARLIFAKFQRTVSRSPYPKNVSIDSFDIPFTHHSNLFSREKLDAGTRFLLSHIPKGDYKVILDLGCANGIVGITAKKLNPSAKIIFSDESKMAIESARINYENLFGIEDSPAEFYWTSCYEEQAPGSVHLVICNPPFHQGNTQSNSIALQMFTDSRRALVAGGILRVIGNTHLRYPTALKKLFGNSRIVAENDRFTIVDAWIST